MSLQYSRAVLQACVCQVCVNLGWHVIQSTPLEMLVDFLERYLLEIGRSSQRYCEQFGRTQANLDDVALTFADMGINLSELDDYYKHVEPMPFPLKSLAFPNPKNSDLNFVIHKENVILDKTNDNELESHKQSENGTDVKVKTEYDPVDVVGSPSTVVSADVNDGSNNNPDTFNPDLSAQKRARTSTSIIPFDEVSWSRYEARVRLDSEGNLINGHCNGRAAGSFIPPTALKQTLATPLESRERKSDDVKDEVDSGMNELHIEDEIPEREKTSKDKKKGSKDAIKYGKRVSSQKIKMAKLLANTSGQTKRKKLKTLAKGTGSFNDDEDFQDVDNLSRENIKTARKKHGKHLENVKQLKVKKLKIENKPERTTPVELRIFDFPADSPEESELLKPLRQQSSQENPSSNQSPDKINTVKEKLTEDDGQMITSKPKFIREKSPVPFSNKLNIIEAIKISPAKMSYDVNSKSFIKKEEILKNSEGSADSAIPVPRERTQSDHRKDSKISKNYHFKSKKSKLKSHHYIKKDRHQEKEKKKKSHYEHEEIQTHNLREDSLEESFKPSIPKIKLILNTKKQSDKDSPASSPSDPQRILIKPIRDHATGTPSSSKHIKRKDKLPHNASPLSTPPHTKKSKIDMDPDHSPVNIKRWSKQSDNASDSFLSVSRSSLALSKDSTPQVARTPSPPTLSRHRSPSPPKLFKETNSSKMLRKPKDNLGLSDLIRKVEAKTRTEPEAQRAFTKLIDPLSKVDKARDATHDVSSKQSDADDKLLDSTDETSGLRDEDTVFSSPSPSKRRPGRPPKKKSIIARSLSSADSDANDDKGVESGLDILPVVDDVPRLSPRHTEGIKQSATSSSPSSKPKEVERAVFVETVSDYKEETDECGEKVWICPGCKLPDDGSPMIGCDICDDWYHWPCVRISEEPSDDQWYCPKCVGKPMPSPIPLARFMRGRGRGKSRGRKKKKL